MVAKQPPVAVANYAGTAFGKRRGVVTGYQLCEAFVKPFTRATGCGVSLLYNATPRHAQAMLSHTWAEDILEVQDAIWDLAVQDGRREELVVWFCIFANYQCGEEEGDIGPTISEQLGKDPFGRVIRSPRIDYMCLCITSQHDPYTRSAPNATLLKIQHRPRRTIECGHHRTQTL